MKTLTIKADCVEERPVASMRTVFMARMFCFALAGLTFAAFSALGQNPNSIVFSKHNLSASGPGTVRASTEKDVCIFCHTPHKATSDGPLWNHGMSVATYIPYSSPTLNAVVGQPTGSSRLCLSCHDGTVALGLVSSRVTPITMQSGVTTMPAGQAGYLGTDLSADHPVSFIYDAALATKNGQLRDPSTLNQDVRLDRNGEMQCTSCHDPHNNQYGNFLVADNTGAALCLNCHTFPTWASSPHAISSQPVPAELQAHLTTTKKVSAKATVAAKSSSIANTGCSACHTSHTADGRQDLMVFSAPERNCLTCHGGDVNIPNVAADFNKASIHPILVNSQSHSSRENPVNPPTRHVTCSDCHNPHAANSTPGSPARASGALASVAGVSAGGGVLKELTHEYELCFRCHGDSTSRGPSRVQRQFVQTNTRLEFNPATTSFHNVVTPSRNPSTASLILPWTASSLMKCSDCHNSDQSPAAGGTGASGPHGSAFVPLIERMLLFTDGIPYNSANFAMCYKCHSSSVVNSESSTSWRYHKKHIQEYRAACTTCHDSHASGQPHLINFNTAYVQPYNGVIRYTSTGLNHGTCTLTCHDGSGQNKPHDAKSY